MMDGSYCQGPTLVPVDCCFVRPWRYIILRGQWRGFPATSLFVHALLCLMGAFREAPLLTLDEGNYLIIS